MTPTPDPAAEEAGEIEEIEVVGDEPEDLRAYPGSANVVTAEDLRQLAPMSASDALKTVPGVHVVDEEGIGLRPNVGLRGLDPNRSRKVLVLLDGVPISLAPYGEPESYWAPPIERIDHIEIVKGSGSIRFGPQTVGGVINYVSAAPPTAPVASAAEVRAGSYGYALARGMVGGTVPGGVAEGLGWRADVFRRVFTGPRQLDLVASDGTLKLTLDRGAHDAWLTADVYREDSRATYLGLTQPQFDEDPRQSFAIDDRFVIRREALAGAWAARVSDGLVLRTLAYGHHIQRNWRRQDYERLDSGVPHAREIPGTSGQPPLDDGGSVYFLTTAGHRNRGFWIGGVQETAEAAWFASERTYGTVEVGARLHREVAHEQRLISAPTEDDGEVWADEVRTGTALAAWLFTRTHLPGNVEVSPGVRVERLATRRAATVADGVDVAADPTTQVVAALIPGVGVSWAVAEPLTLYAGVHRGWAPPRTKDAIDPTGKPLELEAESSTNAEVGARFAAGPVAAEGALYRMVFRNQVVPPSEAGGVAADGGVLVNGTPTLHQGFELAPSVDPLWRSGGDWQLPVSGSWTYNHAVHTDGEFAGNVLPYAPQHLLDAAVRLVTPAGLTGQVIWQHTSWQYADQANTVGASNDGLVGILPGYATASARVGLARPVGDARVEAFVGCHNFTNRAYVASRAPAGIQPAGFRQWLVGLTVDLPRASTGS